MKKNRRLLAIFGGLVVALALVAMPLFSALALDTMPAPLDPQSWKLQRNITWGEFKPNPVIDWVNDKSVKPDVVLKGALILMDFPDRKFLVSQERGSDLLQNPVVDKVKTEDLAGFWRDYLMAPSATNNYVTISSYWKENTYGRQDVSLEAFGPYTLSRFEFQYSSLGITDAQRYRGIFLAGTGMAQEAYNLAKADNVPFFAANGDPLYDFLFFIHAGYDPSGLWQEVGEMMFLSPAAIAYEFSGLGRLDNIEKMITAPGFDLKKEFPGFYLYTKPTTAQTQNLYLGYKEVKFAAAYAAAYAQNNALTETAFETATFRPAFDAILANTNIAAYEAIVPDILLGLIARAQKESLDPAIGNTAGSGTNIFTHENVNMKWAATRYVPWTSWFASMNFWTTEGNITDNAIPNNPGKSHRWEISTQAESDGMATFAHEFGHIRGLPDNYNAPFTLPMTRSYTGPWDLMSRGSFNGPGGSHQRYQAPATMGGATPPNQMLYGKIRNHFTDASDIVDITVAQLKSTGPVVAEIVARNIPTNNSKVDYGVDGKRGLRLTGFRDQTPRDNNTMDPLNNTSGNLMNFPDAPRAKLDPEKWNWGTYKNASPALVHESYTIEVVDRTGYDSICLDSGVLLAKNVREEQWVGPGLATPAEQNYHANTWIIDAHPGALNIPDFIRPNGVRADMTDGDYLQLAAVLFHAGVHNNPSYGDTFTGNGLFGPIYDSNPYKTLTNPIKTTVAGNVVNEWADKYNELHFYILDRIDNPAAHGSYLSYQVAVRSTAADAAKSGGELTVKVAKLEAEAPRNVAVASFAITNTSGTADIIRVKAEGYLEPVLLNNLYALAPGETKIVSAYVELPADIRTRNLSGKEITLSASSETNGAKAGAVSVKVDDLIKFNYNVCLDIWRPYYFSGETLFVDVVLDGDVNYTQIATEIAYDTNLLEYTGYQDLKGWAASVTKVNPNKVAVRSVPGMNMVVGAPCSPAVSIVTLKFTVKDNYAADSIEAALSFASILVSPPGGVTGSGTAPGLPATATLHKLITPTAMEISRKMVIDDTHHGEYCTEDGDTVREFGPGTNYGPIITNGVEDPLFANGGYLFGPTDQPTLKIYAIAVDFTDAVGDMQIPYGRHRNVVKTAYNSTVFDFSDPQIHFQFEFLGTTALKANPKFAWLGTNAQETKGIAQILEEQSMGRMKVDVELLNERLAKAQGIDTTVERTPWFHINGPIFAYSDAGPADCEDYRQFARLYQAAIFAAVEQLEAAGLSGDKIGEGSNIEDIGFIYVITPFNAFGYRLGFQGGGGIMSSYSFNEQVLAQRDSEYRHVPGVLTPGGRMVGSGVFGMKGIANPGGASISPNIGNALHELTHGLGTFDDYSYGGITQAGEAAASGTGNWGVMGSNMSSVSPDPPIWRKFRQGWLYDSEIQVILPGDDITLNLRAAGSAPGRDGGSYTDDPNIKTRMVLIPKEIRTRDTFGIDWNNGWNPFKTAYNWYDWFTNIYVGGETNAIKTFPTFYTLESRKALGADGNPLGRYTGIPATRQGVVVSYIANPTWETGHGAGGFKVVTGDNGLRVGGTASWSDPNIGLSVTILESNVFFDKIRVNYTGRPTNAARHIYQGLLKASENYVTAGQAFKVDFDLRTLGTPAVNDGTSVQTTIMRVATPLGVQSGLAGFTMRVEFDANQFEYVSAGRAPFNYTVNTANAASGVLIVTATGCEMIDKDTILSLNLKAKAGATLGDYTIKGAISDVTLLNWRGEIIKKGDPGFDDVGTFGNGTLAAIYNTTANNTYTPGINSTGGKITVGSVATYSVSGQITCDTPGPGGAGGDWIGIESVVRLYSGADALIATTKSDWDGNFTIKGVPAGSGYYITAEKPKYDKGASAAFYVAGANAKVAELKLARTRYPISGTIYGAENSDGSGKTPLAGVEVYVLGIGKAYQVLGGPAITDAQGRYTVYSTTDSTDKAFAGLAVKVAGAAAKYGAQLTLFAKDDLTGKQIGDLDLNMGTQPHLILDDWIYPANNVRLGAEGTFAFKLGGADSLVVTGRDLVLTETQDVHIRTATKSANIYYQLRKLSDDSAVGPIVRSVGTTNGDDVIRNVPKGQYYLELTRAGYVSLKSMPFTVDTTRVMLRDGQTTNTMEMNTLLGAAVVSGTVTDSVTGLPVEGVKIEFVSWTNVGGQGIPIFSAADGKFSYDVLADDKEIYFSKAGYKTASINVASGGRAGVEIKLVPLGPTPPPLVEFQLVDDSENEDVDILLGEDFEGEEIEDIDEIK